eukprot:6252537-Pyramimonas_sp.AAC.1
MTSTLQSNARPCSNHRHESAPNRHLNLVTAGNLVELLTGTKVLRIEAESFVLENWAPAVNRQPFSPPGDS